MTIREREHNYINITCMIKRVLVELNRIFDYHI